MVPIYYVTLYFDGITILSLHVISLRSILLPPQKPLLWYVLSLYLAVMLDSYHCCFWMNFKFIGKVP